MQGLLEELAVYGSIVHGFMIVLAAPFAIVGVFAVAAAVFTWHIGYTWIGMPPGGGCWP